MRFYIPSLGIKSDKIESVRNISFGRTRDNGELNWHAVVIPKLNNFFCNLKKIMYVLYYYSNIVNLTRW